MIIVRYAETLASDFSTRATPSASWTTEKTIAMGETSIRSMQGKRPLALAFAYRRAVRNNLRRLSSGRK
jgi:hypothetical protein